MARRGEYYRYGFEEGKGASYETDWQEGEMQQKYDRDELGEVAGMILENWQQMAGTIYYQDRTERQLEQFEEGFYAGFQRGVEEQLGKRKRRNPGARWHGREATRAEGDRVRAEQRGSIIGSHFYRGKREAHRESQAASRGMGLNPPWKTYAGGTTALPGRYGYQVETPHGAYDIIAPTPSRRSYVLHFVNAKGTLPGGLWQKIGEFRSPQAAKGAAKRHAQEHFKFRLNPGAAWHRGQAQLAETLERRETRPRRRTYLRGMADAHTLSAHEARKMGLNPPPVAYDVFLRGKKIDTIFQGGKSSAEEVRRGLVEHDGYDPAIRVAKQRKKKAQKNPRPSAIPAHKLAAANRYLNMIRNKAKRQYGFAYLNWLKGGAVGHEPEHPGLSVMGAQAVRMQLDAMKLWENPRGARPRRASRRARPNPDIGMTFNTKRKALRYASAMKKLGHSVSLVPQAYGTWRVVIHETKKNPAKPQGGMYAYVKDRGRAWVESIDTLKGTAKVRFDPGEGMRGRVVTVPLSSVDFRREWRFNKNPIAVYNPPPGRLIYGRVLAVEAQKTNGTHRGKRFRHSFEADSRVAAYALQDGSVLLKSAAGKRLWQDRR